MTIAFFLTALGLTCLTTSLFEVYYTLDSEVDWLPDEY